MCREPCAAQSLKIAKLLSPFLGKGINSQHAVDFRLVLRILKVEVVDVLDRDPIGMFKRALNHVADLNNPLFEYPQVKAGACLLYTSDAADE